MEWQEQRSKVLRRLFIFTTALGLLFLLWFGLEGVFQISGTTNTIVFLLLVTGWFAFFIVPSLRKLRSLSSKASSPKDGGA
jgi:hypothetical protein